MWKTRLNYSKLGDQTKNKQTQLSFLCGSQTKSVTKKYKLRTDEHKGSNYKKLNFDKDKHPVGHVQMTEDISKKAALPERQNTTCTTGKDIMQRHGEEGQVKIIICGTRVRGLRELTAVWPMNGKCEWQEHSIQIKYWLSSYWDSKLQLVISNT